MGPPIGIGGNFDLPNRARVFAHFEDTSFCVNGTPSLETLLTALEDANLEKVTGPRFHARVRFADRVAGPLAIGSGRHRGMGIFAAL